MLPSPKSEESDGLLPTTGSATVVRSCSGSACRAGITRGRVPCQPLSVDPVQGLRSGRTASTSRFCPTPSPPTRTNRSGRAVYTGCHVLNGPLACSFEGSARIAAEARLTLPHSEPDGHTRSLSRGGRALVISLSASRPAPSVSFLAVVSPSSDPAGSRSASGARPRAPLAPRPSRGSQRCGSGHPGTHRWPAVASPRSLPSEVGRD